MIRFKKFLLNKVRKCATLTVWQLFWISFVLVFVAIFWYYDCDIWNGDSDLSEADQGLPTIVWWTKDFPGSSGVKSCGNKVRCKVLSDGLDQQLQDYNVGAYLFYASGMDFEKLPLPRRFTTIIWGLFHEESPRNVEELLHDETLSLFNFSATLSRHSDVPFPLQHIGSLKNITSRDFYVDTTSKNSLLKEIAPVLYLQTDCDTSTERDAYVKELMKYIEIDSYGKCLNNRKLPEKLSKNYLQVIENGEFYRFVARYKFVIAIENGVCEDYVTEKFWRAIQVGSVPIYFGSPSIRDWMPNDKSAILLKDFPTPYLLSQHLKELMRNDVLYEEYLEHKTKGIITNRRLEVELKARPYQVDSLEAAEEFECFVCRKLYMISRSQNIKPKIMTRSHYNCPKPISALSQKVNPSNEWVLFYESSKTRVQETMSLILSQEPKSR